MRRRKLLREERVRGREWKKLEIGNVRTRVSESNNDVNQRVE